MQLYIICVADIFLVISLLIKQCWLFLICTCEEQCPGFLKVMAAPTLAELKIAYGLKMGLWTASGVKFGLSD